MALQFLALGLMAILLYTASDAIMALAAARLKRLFTGRGNAVIRVRQAAGGAMICLGLGLLLARRPAG